MPCALIPFPSLRSLSLSLCSVSQYLALLICLTSRLSSSGNWPPVNVLFIQIQLPLLLPLQTLNCRQILLCNNLLLQLKSPLLAERIHINHGARFMATQRPRRAHNARVSLCSPTYPSTYPLLPSANPPANPMQNAHPSMLSQSAIRSVWKPNTCCINLMPVASCRCKLHELKWEFACKCGRALNRSQLTGFIILRSHSLEDSNSVVPCPIVMKF